MIKSDFQENEYVKEKGSNPPCYCPLERHENGSLTVTLGMSLVGFCPGKIVGEFTYKNKLQVKFYDSH